MRLMATIADELGTSPGLGEARSARRSVRGGPKPLGAPSRVTAKSARTSHSPRPPNVVPCRYAGFGVACSPSVVEDGGCGGLRGAAWSGPGPCRDPGSCFFLSRRTTRSAVGSAHTIHHSLSDRAACAGMALASKLAANSPNTDARRLNRTSILHTGPGIVWCSRLRCPVGFREDQGSVAGWRLCDAQQRHSVAIAGGAELEATDKFCNRSGCWLGVDRRLTFRMTDGPSDGQAHRAEPRAESELTTLVLIGQVGRAVVLSHHTLGQVDARVVAVVGEVQGQHELAGEGGVRRRSCLNRWAVVRQPRPCPFWLFSCCSRAWICWLRVPTCFSSCAVWSCAWFFCWSSRVVQNVITAATRANRAVSVFSVVSAVGRCFFFERPAGASSIGQPHPPHPRAGRRIVAQESSLRVPRRLREARLDRHGLSCRRSVGNGR